MHLETEEIERLLAGELFEDATTSARVHLAACPDCVARYQAAERADAATALLLRQLDVAPPRVTAQMLSTALPARGPARWGLRAAGIMLFIGVAAVAYALPGSPVRKWLSARPAPETPPATVESDPVAGIAVEPGRSLVIVFARTQSTGRVRVSLVDSSSVVVQAHGGAASFSSDDERLAIENDGRADVEIRIPRTAPRVEIRMGDRRVFLKVDDRITTDAPVLNGTYLLAGQR